MSDIGGDKYIEIANAAREAMTRLRFYANEMRLQAVEARERIAELEKQVATAKLEAFEQMARYWESRGCKMEAFEARRMARESRL